MPKLPIISGDDCIKALGKIGYGLTTTPCDCRVYLAIAV